MTRGTRTGIAALCAAELRRLLESQRQKYRLTDEECAGMLAGALIVLCERNGADPRTVIADAIEAANETHG